MGIDRSNCVCLLINVYNFTGELFIVDFILQCYFCCREEVTLDQNGGQNGQGTYFTSTFKFCMIYNQEHIPLFIFIVRILQLKIARLFHLLNQNVNNKA